MRNPFACGQTLCCLVCCHLTQMFLPHWSPISRPFLLLSPLLHKWLSSTRHLSTTHLCGTGGQQIETFVSLIVAKPSNGLTRGPLELATEPAEETCGQRRRRREGGALPLCAGVRDALFPFVSHVTHVLSSLLSFHPALRTHNLTVPPSNIATFVFTNDSAYSNFSATVGEHPCWGLSNLEPTGGKDRSHLVL